MRERHWALELADEWSRTTVSPRPASRQAILVPPRSIAGMAAPDTAQGHAVANPAPVDADILQLPVAHRFKMPERGYSPIAFAKPAHKTGRAMQVWALRSRCLRSRADRCLCRDVRHLSYLTFLWFGSGGSPPPFLVLQLRGQLWYLPQSFASPCQNSNTAQNDCGVLQAACEPAWNFTSSAV